MRARLTGVAAAGLLAAALALALALSPAYAGAAASSARYLRPHPDTGTPHFPPKTTTTEQVRQLVQCGRTMYAVGSFTVVDQGKRSFSRHNAFSFSATAPFTVTGWNPDVNGEVDSIAFVSGKCGKAYLGGRFTAVGGTPVHNLAEVSTTGKGSLVSAFGHNADGTVETLAAYQTHILAGGYFTSINGSSADPYMASLNYETGKDDGLLRLNISGHYVYPGVAENGTRIYNQQLSHSGTLDLVEGDFTSVGGRPRRQIFMLNLASRPVATVTGWSSPRFDGGSGYPPKGYYYNCTAKEPFYIRTAAWSPDDGTVYVASTGYRPWNYKSGYPLMGLCDMAAAFTANQHFASLKWINYDGCYSLYSVAADTHAVYFAGHELWSEAPDGCKAFHVDKHAISAPGFEGLSPKTGKLTFNPTRSRGLGADDMLLTSAGLWIASDNFEGSQMCGKVTGLSGICFLPYGP
ncbi:MAG TPA: hypothetical protein VMA95_16395 [Streptosporangiaceae bacterium]|nr:hypothetical protein [Streptosporangiaceae bacterium]